MIRVVLATAMVLGIVSPAFAASDTARAAGVLGILSPARAASDQNQPPARIQQHLDTYESAMRTALRISDPNRRNTAIGVARTNLALHANRQLTPVAIMRIDSILGLPDSPPLLGTTSR
ncbi:MAG: hypothetical protein JNL04_01750 [Rhodospirillaceae bacterium]|nr:hypothetical protein [Rhodospirillaceae bacterium]